MRAARPLQWLFLGIPFIAVSILALRGLMGIKIMQYEIWVRSLIEPIAFLIFDL